MDETLPENKPPIYCLLVNLSDRELWNNYLDTFTSVVLYFARVVVVGGVNQGEELVMGMRSKIWLDHPIQKRYLIMLLIAMLVPTTIIATSEFIIMINTIARNVGLPEGVAVLAREAIGPAFRYSSILFVIVCVFILFVGLLSSHHIAGPIYQLEKKVSDIAAGDLSIRIRFREKDELHDLARGINEVLDRFEETILKKKMQTEKLDNIVKRLHANMKESKEIDKEEFSNLIDTIEKLNAETSNDLKNFKHFDIEDHDLSSPE